MELANEVRSRGYALLWSTALKDLVAFYRDAESRARIPGGFVPYSQHEMQELFQDGKPDPPSSTLRLVHEAKRHGGRIVSHDEEDGQTRPDGD